MKPEAIEILWTLRSGLAWLVYRADNGATRSIGAWSIRYEDDDTGKEIGLTIEAGQALSVPLGHPSIVRLLAKPCAEETPVPDADPVREDARRVFEKVDDACPVPEADADRPWKCQTCEKTVSGETAQHILGTGGHPICCSRGMSEVGPDSQGGEDPAPKPVPESMTADQLAASMREGKPPLMPGWDPKSADVFAKGTHGGNPAPSKLLGHSETTLADLATKHAPKPKPEPMNYGGGDVMNRGRKLLGLRPLSDHEYQASLGGKCFDDCPECAPPLAEIPSLGGIKPPRPWPRPGGYMPTEGEPVDDAAPIAIPSPGERYCSKCGLALKVVQSQRGNPDLPPRAEYFCDGCGVFARLPACEAEERKPFEHDGPTYTGLREALAAYAHKAWSGWMEHLFKKCSFSESGGLLIPKEYAANLYRQMSTPYAGLSEAEKGSDRKEADRMIAITQADWPDPKPAPPDVHWLCTICNGVWTRPADAHRPCCCKLDMVKTSHPA